MSDQKSELPPGMAELKKRADVWRASGRPAIAYEQAIDEYHSWKAQVHAQAEQITKLADMLKRVEFCTDGICKMCLGPDNDHRQKCELGKLLEPYR